MAGPDLSNVVSTFDPMTSSDKRFKQIFEDEFARVIFCGYRIPCIVDDPGLDILMNESLRISDEIRRGEVKLERDSLKDRLKEMSKRILKSYVDYDITDEFVEHLLPYLTGEKEFGYIVKPKQ